MFLRALVLVWSLGCWGALAVNENSTESYSLRLVDGVSRCRGQLQVQRSGQDWTGVDPWGGVPQWLGDRVCAELDCGPPLFVKEKTVSKRDAVGLSPFDCTELSLIHCFERDTSLSERALELTCSDSVRLVSGRSLCSGSLQIRDQSLDQSWTSVCEGAFGRRGAEVLCRELGCGPPVLQGELSPLGQMFHCEGHESALMDCPRNQTRTNPETCSTLHLTCSELRLEGGPSRCEGAVELKYSGEWRRVKTFDLWDLEAAAAVCRVLDCGSAVSTEHRGGFNRSGVWGVRADCVKEKTAVTDCVLGGSSGHDDGLEVVCSDSVRLVLGQSLCSGSLQIRDQSLDQSWTSVCEGALGRRGAEVLCRELGCGPPLLQGKLPPLGQMFHCEGHESSLMDCPRNQTRTNPENCPRSTFNITCSEPVRLVGGPSRCKGIVEVKYRGEWRRGESSGPWDLEAAAVVCRGLDCGSAVSTVKRDRFNSSDVWDIKYECLKKKAAVKDCVRADHSASVGDLEVECSDSVRLVSGRSLCSGSLQIRDQSLDQSWTSVCEGALGRRGAQVLCRELGCGAPVLQGELSPLGQMFYCEGHESALMDCPRNQTRTDPGTCSTLHLTCSEPLRLVGGSSRCEGTVELKHRGQWRRLYSSYPSDLDTAAAVCRDLDCGSAVSTKERGGFDLGSLWKVRSNCVKTSAAVRDCVFAGSSGYDIGVEVVCSGLH